MIEEFIACAAWTFICSIALLAILDDEGFIGEDAEDCPPCEERRA